jgi:uncharacterized glyoxalase superfamily protein PhnB
MTGDEAALRIPGRYSQCDPWVISADTDAEIAFLTKVFDATETRGSRMLDPEGRVGHVEVELGDAVLMMFDRHPDWAPAPAHLRVYVEDTRETFDRALAAGARDVTRPTDLPFGERVARVRDPQGHLWWIHQRLEDVAPDALQLRFADPAALEALTYVQQSLAAELSRGR